MPKRASGLAGMSPADVRPETYEFVMNAEAEGKRQGRRPTKLDSTVLAEVDALWGARDDDGKPHYSPARIAQVLNERGVRNPNGSAEGLWTAPAIRNLIRTARNQRQTFLLRLGSLLAAIVRQDGVDPRSFRRLALHHQIEPYWIWDRERVGGANPLGSVIGSYRSPIGLAEGKILVYPNGWHIIELWRQVREFDPAVQDVLGAMRHADWALRPDALFRVCERFDASADILIGRDLVAADSAGNFVATERGKDVGNGWELISNSDPGGRWDAHFQPTDEELRSLPSDWDWDDRPLAAPVAGFDDEEFASR